VDCLSLPLDVDRLQIQLDSNFQHGTHSISICS
jgi:hypothetical protein